MDSISNNIKGIGFSRLLIIGIAVALVIVLAVVYCKRPKKKDTPETVSKAQYDSLLNRHIETQVEEKRLRDSVTAGYERRLQDMEEENKAIQTKKQQLKVKHEKDRVIILNSTNKDSIRALLFSND